MALRGCNLVLVVLVSAVPMVAASDNPVLPAGMKDAIKRLAETQSGFGKDGAVAPGLKPLTLAPQLAATKEKLCAIPLREVRVEHPEQFAGKTMAAPKVG